MYSIMSGVESESSSIGNSRTYFVVIISLNLSVQNKCVGLFFKVVHTVIHIINMVVNAAFFVAAPPICLASIVVSASNTHDVGWISITGHLPMYWYHLRRRRRCRRSFDCCFGSNNTNDDNNDNDDNGDDDNDNNNNNNISDNNMYDDDADYMADAVFNDVVSSFIFT
jgi:hypothetical protein